MSEQSKSPTRRIRMALLAGTTAVALIGGAAVSNVFLPSHGSAQTQPQSQALSESRQTGTVAPFDFADVVEQVRAAVVSVQVEGRSAQTTMSGGQGGGGQGGSGLEEFFENMPEDHPMRRFFREYGMPFGGERGERGQPEQRQGPRGMPSMSQGSGFIISEDGYLVTNNHVVSQGDVIRVVMDNGDEHTAEVIGSDPQTDLALLKIETDEDLPFVSFSENEFRVGEWVVAVGNPFGLGGTVTAGIISASGREIGAGPYDDFIQIDAPVNRGNSGGPTFNLKGEVVGVNTAIFSPSGGNVGIAFAIPASVAVPVIQQLREHGTVSRGWLGVQIQPVTDEIAESLGLDRTQGAIVADLLDTGPAGDAGIERGDVILSVNGQSVNDSRDLARRIGGLNPDEEISIELWRDGDVQTIDLTLARQPAQDQMASAQPSQPQQEEETTSQLGLSLAPASTVGAEAGVAIVEVDPDGEGARKGLQVGDIILEAGGREVTAPSDIRDAVVAAEEQGRRAVLLRVQGQDETQRFVALSLSQA